MATKMTREEAIKIVQSATVWTDEERDALAMLIPELAESEDEKIRKEIIHYILYKANGVSEKQEHEWIAYLEKQKEYVSNNFDDVWDEEDCEEIIAEGQKLTPRFKELLKEVCHAWYDRGAKLEKQKEQNKSLSERFRPDFPAVADFIESVDDMEKNMAIGILEDYLKWAVSSEEECRYTWKELANAIQLGIDAMKEQKPAEWSEEDEKDMAHIIRILDDCYVYGTHDLSKTDYENLVNKLKSLRPSWKPSKEQMKALSDACCIAFKEERCFHPSLSRLYHDLMKLIN